MKHFLLLIFLFTFWVQSKSCEIITNFDKARWYLDANSVLVVDVLKIDTIIYKEVDTALTDSTFLYYKIGQEFYHIRVNSIINGVVDDSLFIIASDTFYFSYFNYERHCFNFNDSTSCTDLINIPVGWHSDYNRLYIGQSQIVFLTDDSLNRVLYASSMIESTMEIIDEVNLKGEDYFDLFNDIKRTDERSNEFRIFPNPFNEFVYIKVTDDSDEYTFDLYTIDGSRIFSYILDSSENNSIRIDNNSKVFLYKILRKNGMIKTTGKLIRN